MLADGTYDAIVVDADPGAEPATISLHLAIASGKHRGEMVKVNARDLDRDPLDLLAVPATLIVEAGTPRVRLEG